MIARGCLVLAGLLVAGCGAGPGAEDAARTGTSFEQAVEQQDFDRACGMLSPSAASSLGDDCESGLQEASLPTGARPVRTEVHGEQAQVVFGQDVLFLGLFPGGWKVVAAGCEPRPGQPYDCDVDGG
jgi:hypothetical protein